MPLALALPRRKMRRGSFSIGSSPGSVATGPRNRRTRATFSQAALPENSALPDFGVCPSRIVVAPVGGPARAAGSRRRSLRRHRSR